MELTFEPLGKFIHELDVRNTDLSVTKLMGVNLSKQMMPSVANTIGTDLSVYKVVKNRQFACKLMSVGRDACLPIALKLDNEPVIISSAYYSFEVNDENEMLPEYLMMCFLRPDFDRELWFMTGGDVRGGVTWETFCSIKIPVQPINVQRKIVRDYRIITDRIELLQRINKNLEGQAELLFSRFMSSLSGKNGFFSDVVKIMGGGTPPTSVSKYWNGRIPFFTPGDIDGVFCFSTDKSLTDDGLANCSSKEYPINTTFITCRGTVGKVAMAGVPMAMNQTCYALTGKGKYPDFFVFEYVKFFVDSIKRKANGGVFDAITTKDFETEKVIIPSIEQSISYDKTVEPIFAVIYNNQREIATLDRIRALMMAAAITKKGA